MDREINIVKLMSDRDAFSKFVYTPVTEAVKVLNERKNNKNLADYINLPNFISGEPKAVIFRQLITPNYEVLRFISAVDALGMTPLFFEYLNDKFTSNNDWKYFLGRLCFHKGINSKGERIIEYLTILDFAKHDGKRISDILLLSGKKLVDFHHNIFLRKFPQFAHNIFDGSDWLLSDGRDAKSYYKKFLKFFLKNGVLFENFMLDDREKDFNEKVFLPAFIDVYKETGHKPIIVALEPTEIEGDDFWMSHPFGEKRAYLDELNID